ncbi:zn-dependent hydrolase, glyoxylase [Halogeometricum borinquense DSM 11551]|uniref:Zn-dependent hydrolase, glyoxylase n=2 Tax=Halogeometricum borinquense TaxID=60847 RepID=E4NL49_HALBP|nr:MBL fold metallo-hydrolase [Halogeometricum borinquense]ADQ68298.1 Zn-dependent hydrolase, glyoxylase [Halogeometricum borinquense DSM 11551]ELY24660.1 zn-dependent hydrolase, glyoxylase [Halogeometricum borinquense DSM 11551]RYJ12815.1 MBL fold metallo-hydrolase [Halogeometricum borinquense]
MEIVTVTDGAEQFTCNAYLVLGERNVLVDAGTMPGVETVVADHTDELDAVVLTHQHTDHIGELDAVLDRFDADLYAYGDHPRRDEALEDGDVLQMGEETFEVVYTPGHASDHISLVSEKRIFSGDVVVYNDGAFDNGSFGRTDMSGQSRERLVESLRTLLDRIPETVEELYAGHGDVFRSESGGDSVQDVIERALSRAERREPKYPDD